MLFAYRMRRLRDEKRMLRWQFAAALETDDAAYCKIEKSERKAKREHVTIIAKLLKADKDDLLSLWFVDRVIAVATDDKKMANKALNIAKKRINEK